MIDSVLINFNLVESGQQLLSDFLSVCGNGSAWWYVILLDEGDDSSLASLFGLTTE
jgi:hypothetical protein